MNHDEKSRLARAKNDEFFAAIGQLEDAEEWLQWFQESGEIHGMTHKEGTTSASTDQLAR